VEWDHLDALIDDFETLVTKGAGAFGELDAHRTKGPYEFFGDMVHDWRPVWDKAKEIQTVFNSGIRYQTKELRDQAWTRFNNLRNEASQRANADRERRFSVSKGWRDQIMDVIESARFSRLGEMILFFDPMTAKDMKQLAEFLKDAGRMLSEKKHQMLREHKEECFQRIQEIRQTHDSFWNEYKKTREIRQQEHREKISAVLDRIEANISNNQTKKAKAEDALERAEANISKLDEMLENARGDDHRERVEGWLAEAHTKKESIEQSIRRIEEWIEQDEHRRADILSKQR
jgi:hypothetical protein